MLSSVLKFFSVYFLRAVSYKRTVGRSKHKISIDTILSVIYFIGLSQNFPAVLYMSFMAKEEGHMSGHLSS